MTKILKLKNQLPFLRATGPAGSQEQAQLLEPASAQKTASAQKPVLILGLSGGPDSMALWHLLENHPQRGSFQLVLGHVNHMFRGQDADREEESLRQMTAQGLIYEQDQPQEPGQTKPFPTIFRSLRIDVAHFASQKKISAQDAGHQIRRDFFLSLAQEFKTRHLALAHHRDDRAESFFIHLFHGAGAQGLSALPGQDDFAGLSIWRPLISYSKEEILLYCKQHQLPYFTDPSNEQALYLRNKIRLELLPLLKKEYNPEIVASLARTMDILEEEDACLAQLAQEDFARLIKSKEEAEWQAECQRAGENGRPGLPEAGGQLASQAPLQMKKGAFLELAQARQRRLLLEVLKRIGAGISFAKVEKMRRLLSEERGQRFYALSADWQMRVTYDRVDFLFTASNSKTQESAQAAFSTLYPQGLDFSTLKDILAEKGSLILPAGQGRKIKLNLSTVSTLSTDLHRGTQPSVRTEGCVPRGQTESCVPRCEFRGRRPGDFIKPATGRTKSLKKFLIEKKIPRDERDDLLLLARGSEILWIPGLVFSASFPQGFEFEKKVSI